MGYLVGLWLPSRPSMCVTVSAGRGDGVDDRQRVRCAARRGLRRKGAGASVTGRASDTDGDAIVDLGDAGRPPGGTFGFLPLGPRADRALQGHLAAAGFDGDAVGVELRIAAKGLLDLALDLGWCHARLQHDQVADALDALDPQHGFLGAGALVVPLGVTLEREPAVL